MENLQENKKLNDKGFSLVELIIVIAIMAVLVGVLAPQYLQYVERSRNSTDQDNATAIVSALQVWGSETDSTLELYVVDTTGTTVTVDDSGISVESGAKNTDAIEAALLNASIDQSTTTCVSRSKWDSYKILVKVNSNGGVETTTTYYLGNNPI